MKPSVTELQQYCPEVDTAFLTKHIERLDEDYFSAFAIHQVALHAEAHARISPSNPVEILILRRENKRVDITILGYDYQGEFSMLAGILASMNISITQGEIFTYTQAVADRPSRQSIRGTHPRHHPQVPGRRIIDYFQGTSSSEIPDHLWEEEFKRRVELVAYCLSDGQPEKQKAARESVNDWVAQHLEDTTQREEEILYPVQISIHQDQQQYTRLGIRSQDTPVFLYAISTALARQNISIEKIHIRTVNREIIDEFFITDASGSCITDESKLNAIRLTTVFTKQFTYFLHQAPNPNNALARFERIVQDVIAMPEGQARLNDLVKPELMKDLAHLLGASDYLWEDFIRNQYETLLPILKESADRKTSVPTKRDLRRTLDDLLDNGKGYEEKKAALNRFKNRELFEADMDQILREDITFRDFSRRLTTLAEVVIDAAAKIVFQKLAARYGKPRTVGELLTPYAIMGLGKLGGKALGYASDFEIMVIYSDSGKTDGQSSITNTEFYEEFSKELTRFITAKREGIFRLDMRLRPHGDSGPMAASLDSFCQYYGPGGTALSYERLALVRMRVVAGDSRLGHQVERLRDSYIYEASSIEIDELHELRRKQHKEKTKKGGLNAKFSPGALVDLEYTVQILQVLHAGKTPELRTTSIHRALAGLKKEGSLTRDESASLSASYDFLRNLINGLRMLRGSAVDLFLADTDTNEYLHLARRMGYKKKKDLSPAQQLHIDFEAHTANVRAFVARHFGRTSIPGPATGNLADLVLSDDPGPAFVNTVLRNQGFTDARRAFLNLRKMAGEGKQRQHFARLAVLAGDLLKNEPDPDMALNNWERFMHATPKKIMPLEALITQPRRLEILLGIFSRSQFLANTLIRYPELWDWLTTPRYLHEMKPREELKSDLRKQGSAARSKKEWLNIARRFRQREILRIGTRDLYLKKNLRDIVRGISNLADAILQVSLERIWADLDRAGKIPRDFASAPDQFCILAFGKLGGQELNYSSDIDLIGVYDSQNGGTQYAPLFTEVMETLHKDLTSHTEEGYLYRVDHRLRPYGGSGELVVSVVEAEKYYRGKAALWEIQAALKLRPAAGSMETGRQLVQRLEPIIQHPHQQDEVLKSIKHMRQLAIKNQRGSARGKTDIKSGQGGIRDIEFLVQGLQLIHANQHPEVLTGNTLAGISKCTTAGLLTLEQMEILVKDYIFLRRVEHFLQIHEDRQVHVLPSRKEQLEILGRRMLGAQGSADTFTQTLDTTLQRVHEAFVQFLETRS